MYAHVLFTLKLANRVLVIKPKNKVLETDLQLAKTVKILCKGRLVAVLVILPSVAMLCPVTLVKQQVLSFISFLLEYHLP